MSKSIYAILCIIILSLSIFTQGQAIFEQEAINLPPKTIDTTLPNGFHYTIKQNSLPSDKVEIRLVLRVGSLQEKKGEEGAAHLIEHLAFDGSTNFPKNKAIIYWESLGAKFGSTINAYTGYDRTVYSISIPSDSLSENTVKTISILKDWLINLTLSKEALTKQKAIIKEEIDSYTPSNDFTDIKKGNNPHLIRYPIGTKKQVQEITQSKLSNFYTKWYTPSNASLIIVGDISLKKVEKHIQNEFSNIPNRGIQVKEWTKISFPRQYTPATKIDSTSSYAKLSLIIPYTYKNNQTFSDLIQSYKENFILQLAGRRLAKANSPIAISRYWYLLKTAFLELSVTDKTHITKNLTKGISIIQDLIQNGTTPEEIAIFLPLFTNQLNNIPFEKDNEEWATIFSEMYIFNEKQLTTRKDMDKLLNVIKNTKINEWNKTIKEVFNLNPPIISTYSYNSTRHKQLTVNDLQNAINVGIKSPNTNSALTQGVQAGQIPTPPSINQPILFTNKMIKSEAYFSHIGVHRIELVNGITLYLKPTKNDTRLNLNLITKGGLSLIPPEKFKQMESIISYIHLGGMEGLNGNKFDDFLIQEQIRYAPTIENYFNGFIASAPIEKSKILCNFLYQKVCFPELCYSDFSKIKEEQIAELGSQNKVTERDILLKMHIKMEEIKGNILKYNTPPLSITDITNCNLDSLYSFYKKNFIVPRNMICIATGTFNVDTLKKQLAGVLHKIPRQKAKSTKEENSYIFPSLSSEEMEESSNNRMDFNILYYGNFKNNLRNILTLKLMRDILRNRIIAELRENTGLVYSPYIDLEYKAFPSAVFFLNINGTTQSKNSKKIEIILSNIVKSLQNKAITDIELRSLKQSFLVTKSEYLEDYKSDNWMNYLQESFKSRNTLDELNNYENILNNITVNDLLEHFRSLIHENKKYIFVQKT